MDGASVNEVQQCKLYGDTTSLTTTMFAVERKKSCDDKDFFILHTSKSCTNMQLPPNSAIVDGNLWNDYFGPFGSRAFLFRSAEALGKFINGGEKIDVIHAHVGEEEPLDLPPEGQPGPKTAKKRGRKVKQEEEGVYGGHETPEPPPKRLKKAKQREVEPKVANITVEGGDLDANAKTPAEQAAVGGPPENPTAQPKKRKGSAKTSTTRKSVRAD